MSPPRTSHRPRSSSGSAGTRVVVVVVLVEVDEVVDDGVTVVVGARVVVVLLVVLSTGGSSAVSSEEEHAVTNRTLANAAAVHVDLTVNRRLMRMGGDRRRWPVPLHIRCTNRHILALTAARCSHRPGIRITVWI